MKAIILAAGRGSRMEDLTEVKPKCLSIILGRSLLDWQLQAIRQASIQDIVVVRGYKGDLIQGNFKTLENPDWSTTNMVSTLVCADSYLQQEECLVSYSDIVVKPSHIREFIETPWNDEASIAISYDLDWLKLWSLRNENPLGDAESFKAKDHFLIDIGEKCESVDEIEGQYMGMLRFKPDGWRQLQKLRLHLPELQQNQLDMTTTLRLLLKNKVKIQVVALKGGWIEADNKEDLACFEAQIQEFDQNNQKWLHDWRDV
tara:strand:+ start:3395 stop:4171 length:777 start_codon:yes stop_codon:yes gene_type:complete